jgi:hypothetical protein
VTGRRAGPLVSTTYIEALSGGNHRVESIWSALRHFEQCISSYSQASTFFDRLEERLLKMKPGSMRRYEPNDGSDFERIADMYNVSKHFSAEQASKVSAPVWVTNTGLECAKLTSEAARSA